MLKICDKSRCKPLKIIFKSCLVQGIFPSEWKKANVVPIQKKYKQCIENYQPVSSLSICRKVFERLTYDTMFPHLLEKKLV